MTSKEALDCIKNGLNENGYPIDIECFDIIEKDLDILYAIMKEAVVYDNQKGLFISGVKENELLYKRFREGYYKNNKGEQTNGKH